jgi:hypothetical protein
MNNKRSIASQCKSLAPSSSSNIFPCAESVLSLAPKEVFRCAIRRNKLRLTFTSGYTRRFEGWVGGSGRTGLDSRNESKLAWERRGRVDGLRGLREE